MIHAHSGIDYKRTACGLPLRDENNRDIVDYINLASWEWKSPDSFSCPRCRELAVAADVFSQQALKVAREVLFGERTLIAIDFAWNAHGWANVRFRAGDAYWTIFEDGFEIDYTDSMEIGGETRHYGEFRDPLDTFRPDENDRLERLLKTAPVEASLKAQEPQP